MTEKPHEPTPKSWKSGGNSEVIAVKTAAQILWLPLRIDAEKADEILCADWVKQTLALNLNHEAAYAEYLYFHPSIREFIWGSTKEPLQRYRRQKPTSQFFDIFLPSGQADPDEKDSPPFTLRMQVEDITLYRCPATPDICIVEVHWSFNSDQTPCSLAQWLDFLDATRRTHIAYFPGEYSENMNIIGGRVPLTGVWTDASEVTPFTVDMAAMQTRKQKALSSVEQRKTPMLDHWRCVLGDTLTNAAHQIEDERMPYMAALAVDDPHNISRADWVRLTLADHRGDSHQAPYSGHFLDEFEKQHCYDRFFEPGNPSRSTRYLQAGYAFTAVGKASDEFFCHVFMREHFSRQYAKMGLLLQYNKAALLAFSDALANAPTSEGDDYDKKIIEIQKQFVSFTHRHWFEGFTNQFQGQEIGQSWARHLGLSVLYETVKNEVTIAHQLVMTRFERRQTKLIEKLTVVGVLLAVVAALSGAGFPVDTPFTLWPNDEAAWCWLWQPTCTWDWTRGLGVLLVYLFVIVVTGRLISWWITQWRK